MKVIITHASRYNFTTPEGEVLKGTKLKAIDISTRDDGDDRKGCLVIDKLTAPFDAYESALREVPGVYELSLKTATKQGQLVQVFEDVKFLSPLTAEALTGKATPVKQPA